MKPDQILENLSTHVKNTIANAISLAARMHHPVVTCGHILFALLSEEGCVGAEIIRKAGVKQEAIQAILSKILPVTVEQGEHISASSATLLPELDTNTRRALEKAMLLAYESGHSYVGTEHLLFGLLEINDRGVNEIFSLPEVDKAHIQKQVDVALGGINKFPHMGDVAEVMEELEDMAVTQEPHHHPDQAVPGGEKKKHKKHRPTTALDAFAIDLTDPAVQKRIDPVVGREEEIERLIHILCRRTKNNPILIGEPGVGKTAIVEGLAKRIAGDDVPHILRHKKVYAVDLALLISGTIYRGEFEGRLKQLLEEVSHDPNCILFIDEVHNIIGTGSNQGTMDAANILKPALARGELRCIGATTLDEYKKYISSDPALERRFQPIYISEPSRDQTHTILKGLKKYYEKYHHVTISPEALDAAVDLSIRYIHDNFLPDKALDLLDEAAARVKVAQKPDQSTKKKDDIFSEKKKVQKKKEEAIVAEQFEVAIELKKQEEQLAKLLSEIEQGVKRQKSHVAPVVTKEDVAAVLSQRLKAPVSSLLLDTWEKLDKLESELVKSILGQRGAVKSVTQTLRHAHLRAPGATRPLASFLFTGPSGVGKTAMAKAIAEELYHDPKALIKLDMSEFSESHSVAKLLGSPAGYVGHGERNRFIDAMKQRPHGVILFDEIDKAHADVKKLLFQILDEGTLTDSSGRSLSFRHAIVIMTSNIDRALFSSPSFGFRDAKNAETNEQYMQEYIKREFDPALYGRIDSVCIFQPLDETTMQKIVTYHIEQMNKEVLQQRGITLSASPSIVATLAKKTGNADTGARYLQQKVSSIVNELVVELLKEKKERKKKRYRIEEKNGEFHLA